MMKFSQIVLDINKIMLNEKAR